MQGQRAEVSSLSEPTDFDHESTSTNAAALDQQTHWSNSNNPAEDLVPNFMMPSVDSHLAQLNSAYHEEPNLGRWRLGEPSSSNTPNNFGFDEPKTEFVWSPSLLDSTENTPSLDDPFGLTCIHSRDDVNPNFCLNEVANDPLLLDTTSSNPGTQNNDMNGRRSVQNRDEFQFIEFPSRHHSFKSVNGEVPSAGSSSDPFGSEFINGRHSVDENGTEPDSPFQGRRLLSCKRKALEGTAGQSSSDVRSAFQHVDSSGGHGFRAHNLAGSSSSLSNLSENIHGIGLSDEVLLRHGISGGVYPDTLPAVSVPRVSDSSMRNVRARLNPSHYQDSVSPNFYSSEAHNRHLDIPFSSSFLGAGCVPPLPQSGQRSNPSPIISGTREPAPNSRRIPRSITFIPSTELRNPNPNLSYPNQSSGNVYYPGNVASTLTSRPGSWSGGVSSSASIRNHNYNTLSLNSQRLSGLSHHPLFQSSMGSETVGQNTNNSPSHYVPSESGFLFQRQGEGVQYLSRNHYTGREARSRLVSEIRNVLDMVRRTEVFGSEDRHRDMRLDVDSMSYEEILALEERIGDVSTGLSQEIISRNLKQHKYLFKTTSAAEPEPCCICREEYSEGEDVGSVECGHEFHTPCITQWLMHKNLCPICKTAALHDHSSF